MVYGTEEFTFRDFFAPGSAVTYGDNIMYMVVNMSVLCRATFTAAIIISTTSLLLEREEGTLDRTYVAG